MLKVGITGGIGSGKSVVCRVFETLGIPIFKADDAARMLMEADMQLVSAISSLLGSDVYDEGRLDRRMVSARIFKEPILLQQLNALVHPATIAYGRQWMEAQSSAYVIKEAAIFFESGTHKEMDVMVGVYAPRELRIARTMHRSQLTRQQVEDIMLRQMNEEEKMQLCNHVITNDDATAITPQVLTLHNLFITKTSC